ncbi:MAG: hypothetical protein OH354_04445 [Candidatus Parvarchaeota archaeon]|nr:hypothetical protein [Candidatus Jingweiarchaeum tengchongense]MCW1300528.1 hypothetical protein [Candidatus Jingweiarchaeum tengchongense]MCW1304997.1 hypothetical protein [Candidatus Jingweiarchaeum tengchongense]
MTEKKKSIFCFFSIAVTREMIARDIKKKFILQYCKVKIFLNENKSIFVLI